MIHSTIYLSNYSGRFDTCVKIKSTSFQARQDPRLQRIEPRAKGLSWKRRDVCYSILQADGIQNLYSMLCHPRPTLNYLFGDPRLPFPRKRLKMSLRFLFDER